MKLLKYALLFNMFSSHAFAADPILVPARLPHISLDRWRPTAVMTPFKPADHGFKFGNSFQNFNRLPAGMDFRSGGLCGGMTYAVLDYYLTGISLPKQDYRPAEGTTLQSYLHGRQTKSLEDHVDRWAELMFNPGGARNSEFFKWGLQAGNGGRITELRSKIDMGMPVPLGLKGAHGSGDHQVLAIGYDLGLYKGDLGEHKDQFKIFILDPNYPGRTMELVPNLAGEFYSYKGWDQSPRYQTYFVDLKYRHQNPPRISESQYPNDGLIHEILVHAKTGSDDLRGGNDNVDLYVHLFNGQILPLRYVNGGQRWISNFDQFVPMKLPRGIRATDIKEFRVKTTFSGGSSGDNWNMLELHLSGIGHTRNHLVSHGYHRFTADSGEIRIPMNVGAGKADRIEFVFKTGNDDLRGGNDNLNILIQFRDGATQFVGNFNKRSSWPKFSENRANVILDRPIEVSEIAAVIVTTTFGGGSFGDNWDMEYFHATARGNGVDHLLGRHGFHRFTGDSKEIRYDF